MSRQVYFNIPCPGCGEEILGDSSDCPHCKHPLRPSSELADLIPAAYCAHECGNKIAAWEWSCPFCQGNLPHPIWRDGSWFSEHEHEIRQTTTATLCSHGCGTKLAYGMEKCPKCPTPILFPSFDPKPENSVKETHQLFGNEMDARDALRQSLNERLVFWSIFVIGMIDGATRTPWESGGFEWPYLSLIASYLYAHITETKSAFEFLFFGLFLWAFLSGIGVFIGGALRELIIFLW
jgi:hypothetical protein